MAESNTPTIKKTGVQVGTSKYIDFHEGDGVTIDVEYDDRGKESDVTISASGTAGYSPTSYSDAPSRHARSLLSSTLQSALDELDAETRDAVFAYHEGVRPTETAANNADRLNAILSATGTDNTAQLIVLPYGNIDYDETLLLYPGTHMLGYGVHQFSTQLRYTGADATNGMQPSALGNSRLYLSGFRLADTRTSPTSGDGIAIWQFKNQVRLDMVAVVDFPDNQIYVGVNPATGTGTSECVHLSNIFTDGGEYGLWLQDLDNHTMLDHIWPGDGISTGRGANLIAGIHIGHQSAGTGVYSIHSVKMENNNGAHVLQTGSTFHGSIFADSLIMRGPTASLGGNVVNIGSTDGVYVLSNLASAPTTGSPAVASALIKDEVTGNEYGVGKYILPLQIIDKGDALSIPTAPSGINGKLVLEGELVVPMGPPVGTSADEGTFQYDADAQMLWVYDGGWKGVEVT